MGFAFVLILYVVALVIVCLPAVAIGIVGGTLLSRGVYSRLRRTFQIAGALLPPIAAAYALLCILVMGAFGLFTHRDLGFGDSFEVPLHNEYRMVAIDTLHTAWVGPEAMFQGGGFGLSPGQRDAFGAVTSLQQQGDWLALGWDAREDDPTDQNAWRREKRADHWALFNTRTKERIDVASLLELRAAERARGIQLELLPVESFYGENRFRWYDALVLLLLASPPLVAFVLTLKTVKRMRHWAASTPVTRDPTDPNVRCLGSSHPARSLR